MKPLLHSRMIRFYAALPLLLAGVLFFAQHYRAAASGTAQSAGESWTTAGIPNVTRWSDYSVTKLPNGKVLVAGGLIPGFNVATAHAEIYDPATGQWTLTGSMNFARMEHSATLLPNGKVMVAGGKNGGNAFASIEIYDPATGMWMLAGTMRVPRARHNAVSLQNGKVLVSGGVDAYPIPTHNSAELYDLATGQWMLTGSMNLQRFYHSGILLPNGKVLMPDGTRAEIYDPANGTWMYTGTYGFPRQATASLLLGNGKVLVAGGSGNDAKMTAEVYDPGTNQWMKTGNLNRAQSWGALALLPSGQALLVNGPSYSTTPRSAEIYNFSTGQWRVTSSPSQTTGDIMKVVTLSNGKVLALGGAAELFSEQASGCQTLTISPASLPSTTVYAPYSQTLMPSGGIAPYTFSLDAGGLPSGLMLSPEGVISGAATSNESSSVVVRVTDGGGCSVTRAYTIAVCAEISVFPTTIANAATGVNYSQSLMAVGGVLPRSFSLAAGALPPGLTLSSSGVISGVPTTVGGYSFTIKATDANGCMGMRGYSLTVVAGSGGCSYTVNPLSSSFAAAGGTGSAAVLVASGCTWMATSNAAWITITSGGGGSGNGTVGYAVRANTGAVRSGTLTIAGQTVTIQQAGNSGGGGCTYAISPSSQTFGAGTGTGVISVTANAGCAWTAASNNVSWLRISSGSSGNGNGVVRFSVTSNTTGVRRTGTITVAGQTFTVTQSR